MKTILITGAAGDVGTHLRRELAGKYVLKVSDLRSLTKLNKEERFARGFLAIPYSLLPIPYSNNIASSAFCACRRFSA